jgi:hypothetical protein
MEVNRGLEMAALVAMDVISIFICFLIIRKNWKQYGLLFLISAAVAIILCILFTGFGFYSFPVRLFPSFSSMPVPLISTLFPMIVLVGVWLSPKRWAWKIPFYWGIVHLGLFVETVALNFTKLIKYDYKWDLWDSYTWWWIYLLVFEWIGGRIVSPEYRRPISANSFHYGRWAWAVFHFVVIITIFLGGYYLGRLTK